MVRCPASGERIDHPGVAVKHLQRCYCDWCVHKGHVRYVDVEPFKGRMVDFAEPAEVYRCLTRPGVVYSIRQRGRVVGHTSGVMLHGCTFVVREAGRQRVLREGRKNVHAWVRGRIVCSACGTTVERAGERGLGARAKYNPREAATFMTLVTTPPQPLRSAQTVMLNSTGITYAYG